MNSDADGTLLDQKHETIEVRCARCKRTARAERIIASLGLGLTRADFRAEWLQPPEGWWVLAHGTEWRSPHVRCPGCI